MAEPQVTALAQRIRFLLQAEPGIGEIPMFGSWCFTINGNMLCGPDKSGALMLRVGPARHEEALSQAHVRQMDFTGRPMRGYVFVDAPAIATDAQLSYWLDVGKAFVTALPAKEKKAKTVSRKTR